MEEMARCCTRGLERHPMYKHIQQIWEDMPWVQRMFAQHSKTHDRETFIRRLCHSSDAVMDEAFEDATHNVLKWAYDQRDEEIRPVANRLWQESGSPMGYHNVFWFAAKTLIAEQRLAEAMCRLTSRRLIREYPRGKAAQRESDKQSAGS